MKIGRREFVVKTTSSAIGGLSIALLGSRPAFAQSRAETLLVVQEGGPNSLDAQGAGVNRPSNGLSWNVYDRLVTFGTLQLPDGSLTYDYGTVRGELAESFEVSADGKSITFRLRKDAVFHDGSPVTAEDVKWSLDRAVGLPNSASSGQMKLGSMSSPEQFTIVDAHTIRITVPRPDRYTLPDLVTPFAPVINAKLAKQHATAADPWAAEWLKQNEAGGGAFKLQSWQPGKQTVLVRHDAWKSGPLPKFRRVIFQEVPEAGNRRALVERGDADMALDLLPKDISSVIGESKLNIVSAPMANTLQFVALNCKMKPFDDVRVRQAVAYAAPYESILKAVVYGRGRKLFGGAAGKPATIEWPQPTPYTTNIDQAKKLLAAAGLPNGFETTFSYSAATASVDEPLAILLQEGLAAVGIKLKLEKVPGGQMLSKLQAKELPMFAYQSAALLNDPDYFFRVFYHGSNGPWNFGNFVNDEMTKLIDDARWETNPATYKEMCRRMIEIAVEQVPWIPLWQPMLDIAAQRKIAGYKYWFHRQVDARPLSRT